MFRRKQILTGRWSSNETRPGHKSRAKKTPAYVKNKFKSILFTGEPQQPCSASSAGLCVVLPPTGTNPGDPATEGGHTCLPPSPSQSITAASTSPVLTYNVRTKHHSKHTAVSDAPSSSATQPAAYSLSPGPRLHSETGTCSQSSGQQVQHAPFANIECKLTSAGVGGGEMLGLVDGSLVSVTGAFDCTPRTPPAGHP